MRGRTVIRRLLSAETAFDALLTPYRVRADRVMVGMNAFLLLVCLLVAPVRQTYAEAVLIGGPTLAMAVWLATRHAGRLTTRLYMASAFMLYTGLLIHQSGGEIEAHFAAFGLIGVLLYYRDWRTIAAATVVIYLHHLLLGGAQWRGAPVYVFDSTRFWFKFGVHVAYFLPFVGMMGALSVWLRREGVENRQVIALADRIVRGHLVETLEVSEAEARAPLVSAVLAMKSRLLDLLRVSPVATAVVRLDDDTLVSVNDAWIRTFGQRAQVGGPFGMLPLWAGDQTWPGLLARLTHAPNRLVEKAECMLVAENERRIQCELTMILHDEAEPVMAIVTIEDVTLRRQAEREMQRLAFRDQLTDLPNRVCLQAELAHAMDAWQRIGRSFAVLLLDLDGFKEVNDRLGHASGDDVLRCVARRIEDCRRSSDIAARLGGDEFVVVLHGCGHEGAVRMARTLVESISEPIGLVDSVTTVRVGASIGIALSNPLVRDSDALLRHADAAMYQAKGAGKNQFAVFTP